MDLEILKGLLRDVGGANVKPEEAAERIAKARIRISALRQAVIASAAEFDNFLKRNEFSNERAATLFGVNPRTISRWRSGTQKSSGDIPIQVSRRILGISESDWDLLYRACVDFDFDLTLSESLAVGSDARAVPEAERDEAMPHDAQKSQNLAWTPGLRSLIEAPAGLVSQHLARFGTLHGRTRCPSTHIVLDKLGNIVTADYGILKDKSGKDTRTLLDNFTFVVDIDPLLAIYRGIGRYEHGPNSGNLLYGVISFQHAMTLCHPIPGQDDSSHPDGYLISPTYPYELFIYDRAEKLISEDLVGSMTGSRSTLRELSETERNHCRRTGEAIFKAESHSPWRVIDQFLFRGPGPDVQKEYLRDRFDDIHFEHNEGIGDYLVVELTGSSDDPGVSVFVGGPTITEDGSEGSILKDKYLYVISSEAALLYHRIHMAKKVLNDQLNDLTADKDARIFGQFRSVVLNFDDHVIAVHPSDNMDYCLLSVTDRDKYYSHGARDALKHLLEGEKKHSRTKRG